VGLYGWNQRFSVFKMLRRESERGKPPPCLEEKVATHLRITITSRNEYIYIGETNFCVWEMRADENVPSEKVLNSTNVTEINILDNIFLDYMRRPSCHGGYREME